MNVGQYQYVEQWNDENDLLALPSAEDDQHEYKGSSIDDEKLGTEISKGASAFWNAGGGIFVAGINNKTGKIDGGIASTKGKQPRLEWVDRMIAETHPPGPYLLRWIDKGPSIRPNCGVLVIAFGESQVAPHMASDGINYIRLGSHSLPARYYLVEAIRARKYLQTPVLRAMLERSNRKSRIINLVIYVLNDATALNVEITFSPFPQALGKYFQEKFPLSIPVITREQPFTMELYYWGGGGRTKTFGKEPVDLVIQFEDVLGAKHSFTQIIDPDHGIDPMTLGETDTEKIIENLKTISFQLSNLNEIATAFYDAQNPTDGDNSTDSEIEFPDE